MMKEYNNKGLLRMHKTDEEELRYEEKVNPYHYSHFAIEPSEYITANGLLWEEANVVKYVSRHRFKNGKEDLLKAKKYIDMLINRLYGEQQ